MIRAIALDDEALALRIIEQFCSQVDFIELQRTFTLPREAAAYLQKYPVDLLFLDIEMPTMTGIDFYKAMRQTNTKVIFTTAHSAYAVASYDLNAVDYLLKPFTFERFVQATNKVNLAVNTAITPHFFVRADYRLIKINFEDILYVEGLDDYLKIYLQAAKPLLVRMTMKAMLEKLPDREFVRVHRSFIVPLARIQSVRNKTITLEAQEIPIGSSYEADFLAIFKM
jgi:DNA-binding LytR/AlgR family response regulator